jgi:hypothetical protein
LEISLRTRLTLILVCTTIVVGCTTLPPRSALDNVTATEFVRPAKGALVLLLPATLSNHRGIDAHEDWLEEHLTVQLKAAGYLAVMLDRARYEQIWSEETAAVGGVYSSASGEFLPHAFDLAMASLTRRVCAEKNCDLVVQPRLVWRMVTVEKNSAEWDGVRREMRVGSLQGRDFSSNGTTQALSVELIAATRKGSIAFRRYGGLALPFEVNVRERKREWRKDLFSSDKDHAEAVRVTLEPLTRSVLLKP